MREQRVLGGGGVNNEVIERIKTKIKLGLPLTDYERGLWRLYGNKG